MKCLGLAAVLAVVLLGSGSLDAAAQSGDGLLRGVTGVDPFILPLDKDSATCGIDEDRIRKALDEATAGAPFAMKGSDFVLFVRLSSLPKHGDCFSSIDLGVYWEGKVALPDSPDGVRAKVKLWENGTILISPNKIHWHEVSGILKHLVGNLISTWRADNDKHG